jgi:hypothetical protein
MKIILPLFLACCAFAANAQSVVGLSTGNCNVAETVCTIPNDAGDAITFVYNSSTGGVTVVVTSVAPDLTATTVTYTGALQFGSAATHTNFLIVTPFTVAMSPTAVLSGNVRKTRSGSGRGGWSWHTHWDFQTLAIY